MTRSSPSMNPDILLAGPRGRRLCLEIAGLAAEVPEVAEATEAAEASAASAYTSTAFYAAHSMAPESGRSSVLFGPGANVPPPRPTADDAAKLLDAVPLPVLTQELLLSALAATVNSARYWQEPDGDDALAASATMRRALHRFAEHLLASPLTNWWTAPLDPTAQWEVTFFDDEPRPPLELTNAADTLAQWRPDTIAEETRASKERPADPAANWGGQWWSMPPAALTHSTRTMQGHGPVGLWLVEDGFGQQEAIAAKLEIAPGVRVFEIESPEAWAQLCREHSLEVTASKRHDWYRTTGRHGKWLIPDWALLKEKYDAVHLTMGAYLSTAGRAIPVDAEFSTVLAGWDPDATFWLNDLTTHPSSPLATGAPDSKPQRWLQRTEGHEWVMSTDALASLRRGKTHPGIAQWALAGVSRSAGYRVSSVTGLLGTGADVWERASEDVLHWAVKTRSGFTVNTADPVTEGQYVQVTAGLWGIKVIEPVEVVAVVKAPERVGFSYRTLPGHPVSGEEAFIVHRDGSGAGDQFFLTIRSLTRAAPQQPWRTLFPLLMVVQRLVRRRYLRALR